MDVGRTALYLCCSEARVYALARRGDVPSFEFGGRLVFSAREIDDALAGHRASPSIAAPNPLGSRMSATVSRGSRRKPPSRPRARPVPPPLSFTAEQKESAAKALGLTRAEFDELTPRQYDAL